MQLNSKTHNAYLAVLELARRYSECQPVGLKALADEHQLSHQFLVQVLQQLKRAGVVCSTRGANGGYRLARSPNEITLRDIVVAIDGEPAKATPINDHPLDVALTSEWNRICGKQFDQLAEISLASLLSTTAVDGMYYI